MTNLLGDPMPFRVSTTTSPGTWNPGSQGIRALNGFVEGQVVWMQVWAWNSNNFPDFEALRRLLGDPYQGGGWSWGCADRIGGKSSPFTYTVGRPADPASLTLVNFQGFSPGYIVRFYPPLATERMLGGRWLGSIQATERTEMIAINFLSHPELNIPSGITGGEPVGRIVRSISAGNPLSLTTYNSTNHQIMPANSGYMSTADLSMDQAFGDADIATIEGTVTNALIRLQQAFLGRVELSMRYPLEENNTDGCLNLRKFVIDLQQVEGLVRISISGTNQNQMLKIRVPSGRLYRLSRSRDLVSWEDLESYYVGIYGCVFELRTCGPFMDLDDIPRSADFLIPATRWVPTGDLRPIFLRLGEAR